MTKKEREDAVSRMRRGESWVMVSTEVMARGMDFKGVREVINYDFPQSVQSYVHRIGMTATALSTVRQQLIAPFVLRARSDWSCRTRRQGNNVFHKPRRALPENVSGAAERLVCSPPGRAEH